MNFSSIIKQEILSQEISLACCKIAKLSAFLHTGMSLTVTGNQLGFETVTERKDCAEFCKDGLKELFGIECRIKKTKDKLNGKDKFLISYSGEEIRRVLTELGLLKGDGSKEIEFGINKYLIENACCRKAYISGAFLGSGSATLPIAGSQSGYHLEFIFSNYRLASDFCRLAAEEDIFLKLIERKNCFVCYLKNSQAISDFLAYIGANKSVIALQDVIVTKSFNNDLNRKFNCELGNMTKQVNAAVAQKIAIEEIDEILGLDNLPGQLKEVCVARLNNPESTLTELGQLIGITKSCINHRMRKIMEIRDTLAKN